MVYVIQDIDRVLFVDSPTKELLEAIITLSGIPFTILAEVTGVKHYESSERSLVSFVGATLLHMDYDDLDEFALLEEHKKTIKDLMLLADSTYIPW